MRARTRLLPLSGGLLAAVAVLLPLSDASHPHRRVAAPTTAPDVVETVSYGPFHHPPRPITAATHILSPARSVLPAAEVTVAAGDTLSGIAGRLGYTWQQLAGWNHMTWQSAQALSVGQVLKVPPGGYAPPPLAPPAAPRYVTGGSPPPNAALVAAASEPVASGVYGYAALESLWASAGGPPWAEGGAAEIALCESGGRPWAHNPSGATGLWQILGAVVPGDLYDPMVNAENAVAKFRDSGDTFAQWVCQ